MTRTPARVLFLCTGNSARSILAEALLRDLGEGRFLAHSAGSRPTGRVNPMALETLGARGHDTQGLRSKVWTELSAPGAPAMDAIITVCDSAASEECPVWPGQPVVVHWGLPDPAAIDGEDARRAAFAWTYERLEARIRALIALDLRGLAPGARHAALARIHGAVP